MNKCPCCFLSTSVLIFFSCVFVFLIIQVKGCGEVSYDSLFSAPLQEILAC
ncbi:hypothetical protein Syun_005614 [Stephania yunnanensis]|uniref:Uncharacterized protein n=1 Tax=Stephania yunnanensis TaxID=152371 RepID=A0AAP0L511_9MAGN